MRRRAEALAICTKKLICFPKPDSLYLSVKSKVILNYLQRSYRRTGSAQRGDTFCNCRKNVWCLNRLFSGDDATAILLWFKGSRGSSAHSWKRQWVGGWQAVNYTGLNLSTFSESMLDETEFWFAWIKRRNQSSACAFLQSSLQGRYSSCRHACDMLSQYR